MNRPILTFDISRFLVPNNNGGYFLAEYCSDLELSYFPQAIAIKGKRETIVFHKGEPDMCDGGEDIAGFKYYGTDVNGKTHTLTLIND